MAFTASPTPATIEIPPIDPSTISRSLKRKWSLEPLTPPLSVSDAQSIPLLKRAVHVLSTEATALSYITRVYETDTTAQEALVKAVDCISRVNENGRKLVICGVGKSGHVGRKIEATMKSLSLACSFMHAAEAVHGDLGDVRKNDAVLFITYSGRTAELSSVISHLEPDVPVIILSGHMDITKCPLAADRPGSILLPAPIHEKEEDSFGVKAPTTSTTAAMAIGDMLAITVAERLHDYRVKHKFQKNHPGGAIGADAQPTKSESTDAPMREQSFLVALGDIPTVEPSGTRITALDVHLAAANSPRGWVWIEKGRRIMRPRDVKNLRSDIQIKKLSHGYKHLPEFGAESSLGDCFCRYDMEQQEQSDSDSGSLKRPAVDVIRLLDSKGQVYAVVDFEDVAEKYWRRLPLGGGGS